MTDAELIEMEEYWSKQLHEGRVFGSDLVIIRAKEILKLISQYRILVYSIHGYKEELADRERTR